MKECECRKGDKKQGTVKAQREGLEIKVGLRGSDQDEVCCAAQCQIQSNKQQREDGDEDGLSLDSMKGYQNPLPCSRLCGGLDLNPDLLL